MAQLSEQLREIARGVCDRLAVHEGQDALEPAVVRSFATVLDRADDDELEVLLRDAALARSELDALITAGAGIVARRSRYELGYAGLAQSRGHRTPVAMVQSITGTTRAEAARQVRLGHLMGEADAATTLAGSGARAGQAQEGEPVGSEGLAGVTGPVGGEEQAGGTSPVLPWYEPLTRAVRRRTLTAEAVAAITRVLGEPNDRVGAEQMRAAAEELVRDAGDAHVDELARRARQLRDRIDPIGVTLRAEERYRARSWRFGRNRHGARTAFVEFDDESAAWMDAIVGAAMRPRRGGPRFVDEAENERAKKLVEDSRSNDQVVFDLLMDAIRAGVNADPVVAFGSRQPGVRMVITHEELSTQDEDGHLTGNGFLEENGEAVPGAVVERLMCAEGFRDVRLDRIGNPLDVGREHRLFTPRQRIALSIRDGGCRYPGCDRPPSYTEAHHIDEWHARGGQTNVADGVLLCRHHHMLVHNNRWRIVREDSAYWLIPPRADAPDARIPMPSKSALAPRWQREHREFERTMKR